MLIVFMLFSVGSNYAYASVVGGGGVSEIEEAGDIAEQFANRDSGERGIKNKSPLREEKDERFYYTLDAMMHDDDKAMFFRIDKKVSEALVSAQSEMIMFINKTVFNVNVALSGMVIGVYEGLIKDVKIVDVMVDKVSTEVKKLVGISGTKFKTNGFFYSIVKVFALAVIVYAFYKLVWERSFISSFMELLKFIVVLTTALLLFANFAPFLKGMNQISTEIGGFVGGGKNTADSFSERLWETLVDEPYLLLQYGTTDVDKIGKNRVRELLKAPPGSRERKELVYKEVHELENFHMTYESVINKVDKVMVISLLTLLSMLPIGLLSLATIFTQIWFVIIAIIAPFALLIASFPSQFGVLKRYLFELALPLIIKIALHFVMLILLYLMTIARDIRISNADYFMNGDIVGLFNNAIMILLLFIGLFLLRKRIFGLFSSGSELVGEIREGLGNVTTKPMKDSVKGLATVGGAVVGGVATGGSPHGIAMGANMGKSVGDMSTGEKNFSDSVSESAQHMSRLKHYSDFDKMKKANEERVEAQRISEEERSMTPEQRRRRDYTEALNAEKVEQGKEIARNFMEGKGLSAQEMDEFFEQAEQQGLDMKLINEGTLEKTLTESEHGFDNMKGFVGELKNEQHHIELKELERREENRKAFDEFLDGNNLNLAEKQDIYRRLEKKAIDSHEITGKELRTAHLSALSKMRKDESLDYNEAFVDEIVDMKREQEINEQKERIYNSSPDLAELKFDEFEEEEEGGGDE